MDPLNYRGLPSLLIASVNQKQYCLHLPQIWPSSVLVSWSICFSYRCWQVNIIGNNFLKCSISLRRQVKSLLSNIVPGLLVNGAVASEQSLLVPKDSLTPAKNSECHNGTTFSFFTEVMNKTRKPLIFKDKDTLLYGNDICNAMVLMKRQMYLDDFINKSVHVLSTFNIPSFAATTENGRGL